MNSYPNETTPGTPPVLNPLSVTRTILFWALMIVLAVVLFKMASNSKGAHRTTISYSDFMQQVENKNVVKATFFVETNTINVEGQLREPAKQFRVTVPRDTVSELTERLRSGGASVEVAEGHPGGWTNTIVNFAPLLLLIGFWIFMAQRMRAVRRQP